MTETLNRRDFLFYGGATVLGVTLGEVGRRQLAKADARAAGWRQPGVETWATSVCRECPAACGVLVRLVDGVPVKLEGNPKCPVSRGRLCAKGQAAIETYFDPDRLTGPARRVGARGENHWEPLEWPAAIDILASSLSGISRDGTPQVLALAAQEHGLHADAWTKFWQATGGRVAWTQSATAGRLQPALRALTGAEGIPLFDLENASFVLSFGAPIAEDWLSPVWSQRSFGRFRRARRQSRGRLVQVDGRRSLTARKADEWLAISAERQVYLAYGIASVLLRESRVNGEFLDEFGDEFGGEVSNFRQAVIRDYRTAVTSAATGVPVVTVLRLARELAATPQPLVVVAPDAAPTLVEAVFVLNGLLGALDRPGGIFSSRSTAAESQDDAQVALAEVASHDFSPRVVALRDSSAMRTDRDWSELTGRFQGAGLVVSFSPYLDEAASMADLLLPTPTPLESWHALIPAPALLSEAVALARPAVAPRLDTRDVAEIFSLTAEAAGGALADAGPWQTWDEVAALELDRLWEARRGAPYSDLYETRWLSRLESGGWWEPVAASRAEFGSMVLEAGGWMDPLLEVGNIRSALERGGGLRLRLPPPVVSGVELAVGTVPLESDGEERFSLRLDVFTPAVVNTLGSLNQPALFELLGQPGSVPWQPWAELNPETAREFGIQHGRLVRIESENGSIEIPAVHVEGMPPGRVAVAFVPSGQGNGRWTRMVENDVRRLSGSAGFGEPHRVGITRV